jgi:ATP-binding cassette, subfamily B, multidrug efflux pump
MRAFIHSLGVLNRYRWHLMALLVCVVAVTATSLVAPLLIQRAIDDGLAKNDPTALLNVGLVIAAVGLLRALFNFGKRYLSEWLTNRTGYDFRNRLYDKIQRLSFTYHDQVQTGQLMTRCTEDVTSLSRFIGQGGVDLLNLALLFVGITAFLLNASITLTLISIIPLILLVVVTFHLGTIVGPLFYRVDQAIGDVSATLQENLAGAQVVRAFAREEHEKQKFEAKNRVLYDARVLVVSNWGKYLPTMTLLVMFSTALVLWFGGQMVIDGTLTLGELVAFNAYLLTLAQPVADLGSVVNAAGEAVAGAQRIVEVLDLEEEITSPRNSLPLHTLSGRVEFDQVSFAYQSGTRVTGPATSGAIANTAGGGGERDALTDVSFQALPNQIIALIGPTGSGKTSLVNLIPRFYDTTSGCVLVDGRDIKSVDLKQLRSQIGIVLQTSLLFSSSIRDNIAYGRIEAPEEDVITAAKAARAHDFILAFPNGYDTIVGERGVTLSGGQRQRIAIARALLMDPRILILDDSTSSVDMQTEYLIQQALAELMHGRTTFVIAQRLSTVKRADQILVLDHGRIVQRGTHDSLLEQGGLYKEIYDLQLKDQEQFRKEMMFLDSESTGEEGVEVVRGDGRERELADDKLHMTSEEK